MHVLTDVEEHNRDAAVLTDRHTLGGGDLVVAHDLLQRAARERRVLLHHGGTKRIEHVGRDVVVGFDEQMRDRVAHRCDVEIAYGTHATRIPGPLPVPKGPAPPPKAALLAI